MLAGVATELLTELGEHGFLGFVFGSETRQHSAFAHRVGEGRDDGKGPGAGPTRLLYTMRPLRLVVEVARENDRDGPVGKLGRNQKGLTRGVGIGGPGVAVEMAMRPELQAPRLLADVGPLQELFR